MQENRLHSRPRRTLGWEAQPSVSLSSGPQPNTAEVVRTAAARLFDGPERPDAVLVLPQWLANGIVQGAHVRNLSIPGDLLVAVGVDSDQAQSTETRRSPPRPR
ncbi:substrate-binding domain-containing protein [Streptomyces sp. NPDC004838]